MTRKKHDYCRECTHFQEASYAGRVNNIPVYTCQVVIDWLAETTGQPRVNFQDWIVHARTYACPQMIITSPKQSKLSH